MENQNASHQFQSQSSLSWDAGVVDEAYHASGEIRSHWKYLLESLESLGAEAIDERQKKVRRILRDDGATYKIYDEPNANQTWQLNPVPLLISSEEWSQIESALIERAELLNALLQDIYGEQKLIKQGILPPELIFAHWAICDLVFKSTCGVITN